MKTIKLIFCTLFLGLLASCEITDLNTEPDSPSAESINAGAIYPGMITQTHRNSMALGGRIAGIITQHFDGLDAQQIAYAQYNIGENDLDNLWSSGLYGAGSMRDCFVIMQNNTGEVSALAKLYMAANLGATTSMWGNVPYSDAFLGDAGNLNPTYDDQSELYGTIQTLLDEAIAEGVSSGVGAFMGTGATDGINWEATAHALKARYYLHLTSVNGSAAAQSALLEAQQAFTSTAEQPDFVFSSPAQNANPLALFDNDRPGTMGFSSSLNTLMSGDPRLPLYTTDGSTFAGEDGLFWGQLDSPTPLISYWEVKFIEAEAIVRTGGSDADALAALQDALLSNMLYIGIDQADADAYVNALSLSGSEADKIETIIVEKYKSLYGNAPLEVWVDYRRTGFPDLIPNPDAVPGVNPSGVIPRRFLYPITERTTNLTNYEAAISAQGGHLLDDDLWAFPSN
ncbi:SusD/RagB family nutrient-binding outer membrane lipoprotein [Zobellia nedashkovskayae]|uniref:SusD/RagB family nutrient-binding outer membrane lipoprotein n=1 Tax=Zobellia nedashkovskayae TaxID=2779510 RepID=UPI001889F845|nr:SusD/RagB family nutrient-binding outer membrane lipoprotein [Zobellia nedashkovskayae]